MKMRIVTDYLLYLIFQSQTVDCRIYGLDDVIIRISQDIKKIHSIIVYLAFNKKSNRIEPLQANQDPLPNLHAFSINLSSIKTIKTKNFPNKKYAITTSLPNPPVTAITNNIINFDTRLILNNRLLSNWHILTSTIDSYVISVFCRKLNTYLWIHLVQEFTFIPHAHTHILGLPSLHTSTHIHIKSKATRYASNVERRQDQYWWATYEISMCFFFDVSMVRPKNRLYNSRVIDLVKGQTWTLNTWIASITFV